MQRRQFLTTASSTVLTCAATKSWAQDTPAVSEKCSEASKAMKKAATFFCGRVSQHGGYVYYVSDDLTRFWGETPVTQHDIVVQPPGTPAVGLVLLNAFAATEDPFYLEAATRAGVALADGQLKSGGWDQVIYFAPPEKGRMGQYRHRDGGKWNLSSLDDGQTQTALKFLSLLDQALEFTHQKIHEAASYAWERLLSAQFPNGGFPQVFSGPAESLPDLPARYPDYDWRTQGRVKNYWDHYTLNDGLAGTVCDLLIAGKQVYQDKRISDALIRLGDFLLAAIMPSPQPAWCQQYGDKMQPIWARKFEPPAIASSESQDVMETLIRLAKETGDERFLAPVQPALDYFQNHCLLPDGRLARFYELETNRPLYMDSAYQLTYDDSDVPQHYSWKINSKLKQLSRQLKTWEAQAPDRLPQDAPPSIQTLEQHWQKINPIINQMDDQGRWVSTFAGERLTGQPRFTEGFRYLASQVFNSNLAKLSDFIALARQLDG